MVNMHGHVGWGLTNCAPINCVGECLHNMVYMAETDCPFMVHGIPDILKSFRTAFTRSMQVLITIDIAHMQQQFVPS